MYHSNLFPSLLIALFHDVVVAALISIPLLRLSKEANVGNATCAFCWMMVCVFFYAAWLALWNADLLCDISDVCFWLWFCCTTTCGSLEKSWIELWMCGICGTYRVYGKPQVDFVVATTSWSKLNRFDHPKHPPMFSSLMYPIQQYNQGWWQQLQGPFWILLNAYPTRSTVPESPLSLLTARYTFIAWVKKQANPKCWLSLILKMSFFLNPPNSWPISPRIWRLSKDSWKSYQTCSRRLLVWPMLWEVPCKQPINLWYVMMEWITGICLIMCVYMKKVCQRRKNRLFAIDLTQRWYWSSQT